MYQLILTAPLYSQWLRWISEWNTECEGEPRQKHWPLLWPAQLQGHGQEALSGKAVTKTGHRNSEGRVRPSRCSLHSTKARPARPEHASLGSQKACASSDSNFKAHDISLPSDLYVEWILQIKGNRKGDFANTYQYTKTHTQKPCCLFICVHVPYMCAPCAHGRRPDKAVRCPLLLSGFLPWDRQVPR